MNGAQLHSPGRLRGVRLEIWIRIHYASMPSSADLCLSQDVAQHMAEIQFVTILLDALTVSQGQ
jgi:hypothetical protein